MNDELYIRMNARRKQSLRHSKIELLKAIPVIGGIFSLKSRGIFVIADNGISAFPKTILMIRTQKYI
ncbi:MAG: hypothetical protein ACTTH8_03090 [Treponema sp.]